MKVAHLIDSGGYYGAEIMLVTLCLEQINKGLSVQVISIGSPKTQIKPLEEKLAEFGIPYIRWDMLPLPDLRESFRILQYCNTAGIDVIHSHGYKGNILMGMIPSGYRNIPVITTMHGYTKHKKFSKMTLYQMLDRWCICHLDAVVLVSNGMQQQIPTKKIGKKLHIIENGIQTNEIKSPGQTYQRYFLDEDYKIGSLGRLSYEKNFSMLIDAFSRIITKIPQAKLVIFGEGPERKHLEQQVENSSLKDRVFLPGFLKGTADFFGEIDVFVNCSFTEGMPISILESMKHGCPVIATDIPANKTLLGPLDIDGQFCELNANSLANALLNFFEEKKMHSLETKQRYIDFFNEYYTAEIMCTKYSTLYSLVQKS